jgi:predicted RNA binding protein YcfA (HicA-like mRNA interferase family)
MKLPRDIDGDDLARQISQYGYHVVHQTGSHQRLTAVMERLDSFDHDTLS